MARAAEILGSARHPVFVSAGADVGGVRAMIALAEALKGRIDHADSATAFRNLRALQDAGWIATTLAEVRNRADFLLLAGGDIDRHLPRFYERCFGAATSMPDGKARETWILGNDAAVTGAPPSARHLPADNARLGEIFSVMAALLARRKVDAHSVAGIGMRELADLVERMRSARYGVLAWSAADLDYPHAELAVVAMCELVRRLNVTTRFAILPVAGPRADGTAAQVTTWQTGIPLRVDFSAGAPMQLADRHTRADAIVYVAPLATADAPPRSDVPLVLMGHAAAASWHSDVFVPVATPGIHHAAHYYRTDGIVALRMRKILEHGMLSVAEAMDRLGAIVRKPA
jgi:formylmethanofuran dehydrogenase subunit B